MGVDIGRAFKAPFADPDWVKKTLLGWVWFLLFFTAPAVYGAAIEYVASVARGDERLPEWNDFGGKWVKGFLAGLAAFIYFLPVIVIGAILVVPVALSAQTDANGLTGLLAGGMCLFWIVAAIYTVAVSVLFYAALVNYAMKGHFGAFFEVGEIIAKVKVPGYWMAWLFAIVISFAASAVTSVLSATYIGVVLLGAVIYLEAMMISHLFGQWATDAYGLAPAYAAPAAAGYQPIQPAPPAYTPPAPPAHVPPAPPTYAPPAPPATPAAPSAAPPAPPAPAVAPTPPAPAVPPVPPVSVEEPPAPAPQVSVDEALVEPAGAAPIPPADADQPEPSTDEPAQ